MQCEIKVHQFTASIAEGAVCPDVTFTILSFNILGCADCTLSELQN